MTFQEFAEFQNGLWDEIRNMQYTKGKEYAHSEDRFANFNRLSDELGLSPEQVAWVYTKKHLDSIVSYVKDNKTYSTEPIRGRYVDAIVYLTLLAGMAEEREVEKWEPTRSDIQKLPQAERDEALTDLKNRKRSADV